MSNEKIDLYKIDGGKLGVINLNNMIPVPETEIIRFNIDDEPDEKYKILLRKQARKIDRERETIIGKAKLLYSIVNSGEQPNLNKRCSNFRLLEEMCRKYRQK